jgi:hypothetical protein
MDATIRGNPVERKKGRPMWIYDGEQWTEEGVSESEIKPENKRQPEEMYYPELQVIEIVPVPRTNYVPPFPMI